MRKVAVTYRETFIKDSQSLTTIFPRKLYKFVQSASNKTRLTEILFEYLQLNKVEVLQTFGFGSFK